MLAAAVFLAFTTAPGHLLYVGWSSLMFLVSLYCTSATTFVSNDASKLLICVGHECMRHNATVKIVNASVAILQVLRYSGYRNAVVNGFWTTDRLKV
jgi:hypothetical protein